MKAECSGGGERKTERERVWKREKVIFSMREGQEKKARREWKSVGWEERRERESKTGKERLVRRKVGEGRREFYHGVQ